MSRTHLTFRVPNLRFWLNPRKVWRHIVHQAALKHIAAVNKGIVSDILAQDYTSPEPHPALEEAVSIRATKAPSHSRRSATA